MCVLYSIGLNAVNRLNLIKLVYFTFEETNSSLIAYNERVESPGNLQESWKM